ncbi:Autotransporter secretion inner membrane protein TamB [Bordetella sputigena]|uniref:translocation/assembly module TamB domain-containing protein n=1 Tax=Bordetella sputigena TaxID=1416810 RepID=UPI0039F0EABD
MKILARLLRNVLVWWIPTLLLFLCAAVAAVVWLAGSQAGAQWLARTALPYAGGQAEDVSGSVWRGLRIGHLVIDTAGVSVDARDVSLRVAWPELLRRRLHVHELAAASLNVDIGPASGAEPAAAGPSDQPVSIPLDVVVERLALGEFTLRQDGVPLPVALGGLQAALHAGAGGAQLRIDSLHVGHAVADMDVQGQADLKQLAAPWPLAAQLHVAAHGRGPDSPVCVGRLVADMTPAPAKPAAAKLPPAEPSSKPAASNAANSKPAAALPDPCLIDADIGADGSLDGMSVTVAAQGAGAVLSARAQLAPRDVLPVRSADASLRLPDGTSAAVTLTAGPGGDAAQGLRLQGTITADRLDLARLSGNAVPPAVLTTHGGFNVLLTEGYVLRDGQLDLAIDQGSRWNRQPLQGTARGRVTTAANDSPSADWTTALADVRVQGLAVDLRLGPNRLQARGDISPSAGAITIDAGAPALAAFWPGLEGAANLQARLTGTPARHRLELRGGYTPARSRPGILGSAPMQAALDVSGGYGTGQGTDAAAREPGWRGTVSRLIFTHAGFEVSAPGPVTVAWLPRANAPLWQWQAGAARIELKLPGGDHFVLDHAGSRGGPGRWETAGRVDDLVLTPAMARRIQRALGRDEPGQQAPDRPQRVNARVPASQRRIAVDVSWDLRYAGALTGKARVARRSGDLLIPGDPPIPLGLRDLVLDLNATSAGGRNSRVDATLRVDTASMGSLRGTGTVMLAATPDGGIGLAPRQPMRASLDADISDLKWVELFTGDSTDIGGALKASIQAQGMPDGAWTASGTVRGTGLRYVRIDDGVRMVDGTLSARLQEDRLIVESLRFPAVLRVLPTEARTRDWVTRDPDAKNGYIDASGSWRLADAAGQVHVVLRRFPVIQRADRFAMMSGAIDIDAALPRLSIRGNVKADAGWASLEVLSEVPSLDGDVVVHRPGADNPAPSTPLQTDMDLNVDLGSRFYLTGMGLDAALGGSIRIRYVDHRLSGTGALRTRAGRIDAYGQRLQLRRGTVTFQGALDNPLLDIEALRTGEQVEAGVRVSGTAQRPRIDLISYPDVSDEEKLSWLVLGRAPDASGNDTALLVSLGTALLGNGEPFYKKFGLDDVTVRNGTLGGSNSLLPDQTVAGNVNQDASQTLATQFVVASKNFADGVTLSVEQALAGSETVGRLSYRLSRRWSVDLKGGSVNGLELVYRTFLGD